MDADGGRGCQTTHAHVIYLAAAACDRRLGPILLWTITRTDGQHAKIRFEPRRWSFQRKGFTRSIRNEGQCESQTAVSENKVDKVSKKARGQPPKVERKSK